LLYCAYDLQAIQTKAFEMSRIPKVVLLMSAMAGYDRGLLRGIAKYARFHGPWAFILSGDQPKLPLPQAEGFESTMAIRQITVQSGRRILPDLRRLDAAGFIGRIQTPEVARVVLDAGIPAIVLDLSEDCLAAEPRLANLPEMLPDGVKAGRLAAEHLLDRGFRQFAFCGYPGRIWSRRREEGFQQRLQEAGLSHHTYQPPSQKTASPGTARESLRLVQWLKSLPKPVGLLACNDIRGRQVIEACATGDILVPDEVAVVGVDEDRLFCELSNPSLSSVMLNTEQAGHDVAELLDQMMAGQQVPRKTIVVDPLWVVPRRSTEVFAVEDRDVANAMRFIRDNARRPIGVEDVVRESAMSRRALEIRFKRLLGRSIRDEIERVRLAWTKQLLVETEMPIWKVIDTVGFSSLSYGSKVFHRAVGVTLARYRREHRAS
jgi:LacI family transcriptional regulator